MVAPQLLLILLQTVVGANPWVIHRNTDVYGDDVEEFRPERWLGKGDKGDMRLHFLESMQAID